MLLVLDVLLVMIEDLKDVDCRTIVEICLPSVALDVNVARTCFCEVACTVMRDIVLATGRVGEGRCEDRCAREYLASVERMVEDTIVVATGSIVIGMLATGKYDVAVFGGNQHEHACERQPWACTFDLDHFD